jgi:branched-chain amino acid aminotransferase
MEHACLDGALVPLDEARISVTDEGLLRGDGVFEVMRLYSGVPFAREQHLQRMARSAQNLRLDLDVEDVARDIETLLASAPAGDALLRAVATRGGRRILLIEPLPVLPSAITLGYVTFAPVRVLDGVKSLSYGANMLATRLARERGFDEALLVSPDGHVLELPTAAFFWVAGGQTCTPPLSEHILDSITRRIVIDVVRAREQAVTAEELRSAEEAFVASSVREVIAVSRIEDLDLLPRGGVTRTAAEKVRRHIAAELAS